MQLQPKDIDWEGLNIPQRGFFLPESRYYRACAALLAKLLATRGFIFLEPAETLHDSWKKLAIKCGIRLSRQRDWNLFWLTVSYQIVTQNISPIAATLANELKKTMVKPVSPYPPRQTYIKKAVPSKDECKRVSQILTTILATVSAEADALGIDRPTYFGEMTSLRDAFDAAIYSIDENREGGQSDELIKNLS